MKIRNGFVSNSSSSSFVIGIREDETCPNCGRSLLDIVDIISESDLAELEGEDVETTLSYLRESYISEDDDFEEKLDEDDPFNQEYLQIVNDVETYSEQGYRIIAFTLDYKDELFIRVLEKMAENDSLVIIHRL